MVIICQKHLQLHLKHATILKHVVNRKIIKFFTLVIAHSRIVHPCYFVPRCPLPRFQSPLRATKSAAAVAGRSFMTCRCVVRPTGARQRQVCHNIWRLSQFWPSRHSATVRARCRSTVVEHEMQRRRLACLLNRTGLLLLVFSRAVIFFHVLAFKVVFHANTVRKRKFFFKDTTDWIT